MKKALAVFAAVTVLAVPVEAQTRGDLEDRVAHLEIVVGKLKKDNEVRGETIRRLCRKVGMRRCPIDGFSQ